MRAPSSSDSARLAEALPLWARTPDNGYSARNTGEAGSRDKAKAAPGQGELFPAWLAIAAIAHNLLRAAGTPAGRRHAKARAATIRRDLIAVAGRAARHGRGHLTLHLPEGWHREHERLNLWEAACGPPIAAA